MGIVVDMGRIVVAYEQARDQNIVVVGLRLGCLSHALLSAQAIARDKRCCPVRPAGRFPCRRKYGFSMIG